MTKIAILISLFNLIPPTTKDKCELLSNSLVHESSREIIEVSSTPHFRKDLDLIKKFRETCIKNSTR